MSHFDFYLSENAFFSECDFCKSEHDSKNMAFRNKNEPIIFCFYSNNYNNKNSASITNLLSLVF